MPTTVLSNPHRTRRRCAVRTALLVVLVLVVAGCATAGALGLAALRDAADRHLFAETTARQLSSNLHQSEILSGSLMRSVQRGTLRFADGGGPMIDETSAGQMQQETRRTLARLRGQTGDTAGYAAVERAVNEYDRLGVRLFRGAAPSEFLALSAGIAQAQGEAIAALDRLAADEHAQAGGAQRLADVATAGVVGGLVLVIAVLLWQFDRFRSRAERRMLETLHEQATHDELTGLGNRRAVVEELPGRLERASAADPVQFLLFDLNDFKAYNDTFGHPAGDALLRRLSTGLASAIGERGRAYRVGGDEFCAVVGSGPDEVLVHRCIAALAETGDGYRITTACGSVSVPAEAGDLESAFALADERMYGQKAGRCTA